MTSFSYFANGWTSGQADPAGIRTGYDYNSLGEQSSRVLTSAAGRPRGCFGYPPAGHRGSPTPRRGPAKTETRPNGNVATSSYYANELPYSVTEKTSAGTLMSSHQYQYDPDGDTSQNIGQLMSADSSGSYLNHTLAYT